MGLKRTLYKLLKYSNDASALMSGKPKRIAHRIIRRAAGRATGRALRRWVSRL